MNQVICSSTVMWLLSSTTASSAWRSGEIARVMSALSRATDVGPDLLERYGVALGQQFVVAAPGPDFGIGRHEDFHFGIGEYHRADVAAVHHHAPLPAHRLLHGHEFFAVPGGSS